jgi:hypothetical protein
MTQACHFPSFETVGSHIRFKKQGQKIDEAMRD